MIDLEERPVLTPPELPRGQRVSIGRVITGALVLLVGIGWMVDLTTTAAVSWGLLVPAALMLVGMGVMYGSGRQDVGGLISVGVLLTSVTVVSGAVSFIGPWNGVGEVRETPAVVADVHDLYEHGMGDYLLDLGAVTFVTDQTVSLNMGIGAARVVVPPNAQVVVHAETGIGKLTVFGEVVDGLGLSLDRTWVAPGPTIHINAELGIGELEIAR
ncbi:MAG: hypothetical protein JJE47_14285 [Acidimicrobiia bacterium]|nr:hypothetical protein [Acidimicrobiia bacterium]